MNQNIPAPEPEQQATQPLATASSVCREPSSCVCSVLKLYHTLYKAAETTLARCIASYYECAASLNAVCNVVLGEKSGIMWHYKQYNPV